MKCDSNLKFVFENKDSLCVSFSTMHFTPDFQTAEAGYEWLGKAGQEEPAARTLEQGQCLSCTLWLQSLTLNGLKSF